MVYLILVFLPHSALREESKHSDEVPASSTQLAADADSQRLDSELRPNANPKLDSFEAVMQAMDAELLRARRAKKLTDAKHSPAKLQSHEHREKGKQKAEVDDEDIAATMDVELRAILRNTKDDDDDDEGDEAPMDYTLIKNFLESFKSQQGLSGPVSNLLGRLQPGLHLPRDES